MQQPEMSNGQLLFSYLFNWLTFLTVFPEITLGQTEFQKGLPKTLWVLLVEDLQAGCPSCHPNNSVKALKDDK